MKTTARTILAIALLLATSGIAAAQVPDFSGTWQLTSQLFPPIQPPELGQVPCDFEGSAVITQDGSDLGGTADLTLVSGPVECPAQMSAEVSGTVGPQGGVMLGGSLLGGNLGTAFFDGTGDPQAGLGGTAAVETGPFGGANGTWAAVLGGPSILEIPTLTAFGLVLLIGLLAVSALYLVRRRPAV